MAVLPKAKPENPLGFQPSYHPYQFLLKSFRFPGAKTARKRFLLWKMGFSAAKIAPHPPYTPPGTIKNREGLGPLELSVGFLTACRPRLFSSRGRYIHAADLRQHRTNEAVGRQMDFSSDANADSEGLLEVNRGICMPQMAEKTSPDAPPSCAVSP